MAPFFYGDSVFYDTHNSVFATTQILNIYLHIRDKSGTNGGR